MKMQKRVLTILLSKLASFRLHGFSHLISGVLTNRVPPRLFRRSGRDSNTRTRQSALAQSNQHQENDYSEEPAMRQRHTTIHENGGDWLFSEEKDTEWSTASSNPQGNRILRIGILDDNPAILGLFETIFTMDGHIVSKHTTGSSLLDLLFSQKAEEPLPYDLVILDLLLPGTQSGADVFFAIRKQFPADVLPIIVITAVDEPTLKQFRHILPDDVSLLRKPCSPHMLRQLIAQLTGSDNE